MSDYTKLSTLVILILALLAGLILSHRFRSRAWAPMIWMPTTLIFASPCLLLALKILGLLGLRGPDSGWGGLEVVYILLPQLGICAVGLIFCRICRPRNWNILWGISAALCSVIVLYLLHLANQTNVEVALTDTAGNALRSVDIVWNDGPRTYAPTSGVIQFSIINRRYQSKLATYPWSCDDTVKPLDWTLRFGIGRFTPNKLSVEHWWSHQIGKTKIDESFTELMPLQRNTRLQIPLPPRSSFEPTFIREKIQAVLANKQKLPREGYSGVCRNLESIEFIPELINQYRQMPERRLAVLQALADIASILERMDTGCRLLQKSINSQSLGSSTIPPQELEPLCKWAKIPYEKSSSSLELLALVRAKIATHVRPLIDLALEDGDDPEGQKLKMLAELGPLSRSDLPRMIHMLLEKPPSEFPAVHRWHDVFRQMRATKSEVEPLRSSGNPMLERVASGARSDTEER